MRRCVPFTFDFFLKYTRSEEKVGLSRTLLAQRISTRFARWTEQPLKPHTIFAPKKTLARRLVDDGSTGFA